MPRSFKLRINFPQSRTTTSVARTKANNTEANLRRLALGGQTVKNLLACKFDLQQSGRKPSQVRARCGQAE